MLELPDDFETAPLAEVDPAIAEVLRRELHRQQNTLEMIASENFVPQAVLDAAGSGVANKEAEGYLRRRSYGGGAGGGAGGEGGDDPGGGGVGAQQGEDPAR